jgi:uncharacterized protein (TIGR04551 family)
VSRKLATSAIAAALALAPGAALATGFTDTGEDIKAQTETAVKISGALRVRGAAFYNLDLDRGPTPSGQLFFPVPLSDPKGQWLAAADMRLRTDISFYAPFASVAVKARLDMPDNLTLGGAPDGIPGGSTTQLPTAALRIKRVYGEALTPFGVLAAGRMGSHWGLGMLTNGGDCADCNSGDAADRIAFVTPLGGFIWAASFDFSSAGPSVTAKIPTTAINIDPSTAVRTVTLAFLRWRDERALERRRKAGKSTFELGAYVSHRWQKNDVPASYLPVASAVPLSAQQVMYRGYTATAMDAWTRISGPWGRIEMEGAVLLAKVDQPSLIPGVLLNQPVKSLQIGVALESEFGAPEGPVTGGLDVGYASGDPAPGFGVNPGVNAAQPKAGDLDGPQANPPYDNTVNNFRFHPDYRIDRILFREIIGTVTDAVYLRPHVRWNMVRLGTSWLTASLAGVVSFATFATSTPGGKAPLGVELDPTLSYGSKDGFGAALEHAVLFPLAGLDHVGTKLRPQPAQLVRLRLMYAF